MKVLAFSGSYSANSINRRLLDLGVEILRSQGVDVEVIALQDFDLPIYRAELDTDDHRPEEAARLGDLVRNADGLLIASPEYNFSIPGGLKNVIDWLSRLRPQPFKGKVVQLLSASPSLVGGNRGLIALRLPLEVLGGFVLPNMFSFAAAHKGFSDEGAIADEQLAARFEIAITTFAETTRKLKA